MSLTTLRGKALSSGCLLAVIVFFYVGASILRAEDTLDSVLDHYIASLARLQADGNYFSFALAGTGSERELLFQDQAAFTRLSSQSSRRVLVRGCGQEYIAVFQANEEFAHVNSMIQTGGVSPREYTIAETDLGRLFGFISIVKREQTYYDVIRISDFFRSPETEMSRRTADGRAVVSLKREIRDYSIEMLLAPEFGWSIKQIVINHVNGDGNGITKSQFEASEFENHSGIFIPNKLTISRVLPGREFPNLSWRLTDFRINQGGDLGFAEALSGVPNYAPITIQDAFHLSPSRTIIDGKVVVLTDELALAQARGHGFIPGPTEPRFWLVTIGILLMLVGGGKMLYDHIKKTKGGA